MNILLKERTEKIEKIEKIENNSVTLKEKYKCPHPLGSEGLKKAYNNLKRIKIHPDDLADIT